MATARRLGACEDCAALVSEVARESTSVRTTLRERLRPSVVPPGTVVAGRYLVRRSVGVGAMGEVHQVDDRLLGTTVALKTLNARLSGEPDALARLKAEVAIARRVTHPNVCRIFDLGIDQSGLDGGEALLFLTMEYLPGSTLADFVRRHGPLPPSEALPLLRQLAAGLAAAHAVGVVHRDLKSENVMLVSGPERHPRAVVTDFGLAGLFVNSDAVRGGTPSFSGTLAYAAPERLTGRAATPCSDVYSFGMVAHELLVGALPSAGTEEALCRLPARYQEFLARTMEPDSARRLRDGAALISALLALSASEVRGQAEALRRLRKAAIAVAVVTFLVAAALSADRLPTRGGRPQVMVAPQGGERQPAQPMVARLQDRRPAMSSTQLSTQRRRKPPGRIQTPDRPEPTVAAPVVLAPSSRSTFETFDEIVRELPSEVTTSQLTYASDGALIDPFDGARSGRVGQRQ